MKKCISAFLCVMVGNTFSQSVPKTIQLLPDTGMTTSYTTTFGEDNDYTINAPSFTNNNDGTITDNVTGLMWQQVDGGEMTIESAHTYCDILALANYTDWRLPTPIEAFSILNQQKNNPAMNTVYFPSTGAEYWWTSDYQAGDNTKVWVTNSGGGIGNHPKTETVSAGGTHQFHVRAVRNTTTPTLLPSHFTDNGDGTITDHLTQLIWQKTPNTAALTWEQALSYAEGLVLAGANDWRLPNIKELQSLNDETISNPSVNTNFFSSIGIKNYWSATTLLPNPTNLSSAWYWNTQFGITTYDNKSNSNYVICVRGIPTSLALNQQSLEAINNSKTLNPFNSNIHIANTVGSEDYELFSLEGKTIYKGKNIEQKDFSNLANGIYFLRINNAKTIQLIKE
ncbi:DUF1566 domain-containing protein [Flavobacterium sp. SUN046]|uniref:Lcl domain-containing protein n=1 Tax=Flavobacterium sp. SUN046 TaxID=3002440 RepID=UPI002DB76364|nr:DUF1566 domain-containing protein [Flavobacterium sp. SUN046]MEC4048265.1 DUF1566 domain-containing protein [Flavobacterium sp. SUN046]